MTIDQAIEHCEEKADCSECGMEHKQLGNWLKMLKEYMNRDASQGGENSIKIEKAIEIISRKTSIPNEGESFQDIEAAYDMAIAAMQKDIYKKCACGHGFYPCPNCGEATVEDCSSRGRCSSCGQAILH